MNEKSVTSSERRVPLACSGGALALGEFFTRRRPQARRTRVEGPPVFELREGRPRVLLFARREAGRELDVEASAKARVHCARHVRVSEFRCPFCRAALSDAFRATPARQAPRQRLRRAALFALGTGVAVAPAACSAGPTLVMTEPSSGTNPVVEPGDDSSDANADASPMAEPGYGIGPGDHEAFTDGGSIEGATDGSSTEAGDASASDAARDVE